MNRLIDIFESTNYLNNLDVEKEINKIRLRISQLSSLALSIEEFGICKSTIRAINLNDCLEIDNIIPSFEDLNDMPTKDKYAKIAVEGIIAKIRKMYKNLNDKSILLLPILFYNNSIRRLKKSKIALIENINELKSININDDALKKKTINDYKFADYYLKVNSIDVLPIINNLSKVSIIIVHEIFRMMSTYKIETPLTDLNKSLSMMIKEMNKAIDPLINDLVKDYYNVIFLPKTKNLFGGEKKEIFKYKYKYSYKFEREKKSLYDLGYNKNNTLKLITRTNKFLIDSKDLEKIKNQMTSDYAKYVKEYSKKVKEIGFLKIVKYDKLFIFNEKAFWLFISIHKLITRMVGYFYLDIKDILEISNKVLKCSK